MQIRFRATTELQIYQGAWQEAGKFMFFRFDDGAILDIPDGKAQELLRDFPRNFEAVTRVIEAPPKDRMIRKAKTK